MTTIHVCTGVNTRYQARARYRRCRKWDLIGEPSESFEAAYRRSRPEWPIVRINARTFLTERAAFERWLPTRKRAGGVDCPLCEWHGGKICLGDHVVETHQDKP